MDSIQEYWNEDRGMVIGGIVVAIALIVFFFAMGSAFFGKDPAPLEPSPRFQAGPALPTAGRACVQEAANIARVSSTFGKQIVDSPSSEVPDITPETMESLLDKAEEDAEAENPEDKPSKTDDPAEVLAATISALPMPATTDAIMGRSLTSVDRMVQDFESKGVPYPAIYAEKGAPTMRDWCQICLEEATAEGVRAEVVYAQSMHETANLQFGNQVSVEQCNFGGLGATNDGSEGASFADVRIGLRAQIQHLKAYASTEPLTQEVVDERFDLVERGSAPTVIGLGGKWAVPGDTYGQSLMEIVNRIVD